MFYIHRVKVVKVNPSPNRVETTGPKMKRYVHVWKGGPSYPGCNNIRVVKAVREETIGLHVVDSVLKCIAANLKMRKGRQEMVQ